MNETQHERVPLDAPLERRTHKPIPKSDLVRLTVNLIPRAYTAMVLASEITGDSRTDTINRAVQLYAYVEHVISNGGELLVRENGELSVVKML